jgi:ABC-2 type transport system permease protein
MNIFKFELRMMKKSIFLWAFFVPFGLVFYMLFFPMMQGDTETFQSLMDGFPDEFLAFFGMSPELPVFSLLGYFGLSFGMIQIPLAIQASNYGFHILSVEERELTADFLLSKPITRGKILVFKCLAAFTGLTIVNIAVWISSILILLVIKGDESPNFMNVNLVLSTTVFFQLVFFSIGLLISVSIKKVGSVLSFSMALGFGLYLLSSFGSILSSNMFKVLSPYSHFDPGYILINGHYDWGLAIISFLVILIAFPLSYLLYKNRNIASL